MSRRKRKESAEGESMDNTTKLEKMYRLSAVAERADLSLRTIQEHAREGKLKVVRIGGQRIQRVRESELKRYLDAKDERDQEP
jgi:excisionase family DNA binding protein